MHKFDQVVAALDCPEIALEFAEKHITAVIFDSYSVHDYFPGGLGPMADQILERYEALDNVSKDGPMGTRTWR